MTRTGSEDSHFSFTSASKLDVLLKRAHGFLPKTPIRRDKVNEIIAPFWLKRFPPLEFENAAVFNTLDESTPIDSEELACSPDDITEKLMDIESLFEKNAHVADRRLIYDQLHELKGDLRTLTCDASMVSIFGMINLILSDQQSPDVILDKWHALRDNISKLLVSFRPVERNSLNRSRLKRSLNRQISLKLSWIAPNNSSKSSVQSSEEASFSSSAMW